MAKRNVVWTRTADIQFVGVLQYWVKRNRSNSYSKRLLRSVAQRTEQIAKHPFSYRLTDFQETIVASLKNFSIYYKVPNSVV